MAEFQQEISGLQLEKKMIVYIILRSKSKALSCRHEQFLDLVPLASYHKKTKKAGKIWEKRKKTWMMRCM